MKVAIIGGGSSAHLLAVLLSGKGHEVRILTSKPHLWNLNLELEASGDVLHGCIKGAASDPMSILTDAELAVFCMPVHQYPVALTRILPALAKNRNCIVGTVYGQAGFDWMIKRAAHDNGIEVPHYFSIGLLPWIARTREYGRSSISYGPKMRNGIATSDSSTYDLLQTKILDDFSFNYWGCGKFEHVPNFVTLALTVDNQIIHPSRCYALTRTASSWRTKDEIPYFYRDWDDYSAEVLRGVDIDYTIVRSALVEKFPSLASPYNLDYLGLEHWSYGSHNPDIKASFVNSTTLGAIKPPVVLGEDGFWHLDVEHRFFKDDFAFGLEIAKWFAGELKCEVPHIDQLICWYEKEIRPRMGDGIRGSGIGGFRLEEVVGV